MNEAINQPIAGSGNLWNSRRRAVRTWLSFAVGVAAIAGIAAKANSQRIQDGVARGVTLRYLVEAVIKQTLRLQRHGVRPDPK